MPHIPGKARPKAWIYKDPFDHQRHLPFLKARAQAKYRDEPWELTPEDWFSLWSTPELWAQRGRHADSLCLVRIDQEGSWSMNNVEIIVRLEQLRRQRAAQAGLFRGPYNTRKFNV